MLNNSRAAKGKRAGRNHNVTSDSAADSDATTIDVSKVTIYCGR